MGNPIQDWLDKFSKQKPTASGKTTVSTKAKPTASGKAGVGAKTSKPVTKAKTDLAKQKEAIAKQREAIANKKGSIEKQKEAIAKKTNQEIINAAYKVAEVLKLKGGPWPLLRSAGWGHLTDNRGDLYKGPAVDEIKELTEEQKTALKKVLGL